MSTTVANIGRSHASLALHPKFCQCKIQSTKLCRIWREELLLIKASIDSVPVCPSVVTSPRQFLNSGL